MASHFEEERFLLGEKSERMVQPRTQGIRQRFRPGCTCCSDTLDITPLFVSSWRNCPAL